MTEQLPDNTTAAFGTLCGATVVIVPAGPLPKASPDQRDVPGFTWRCLGCGDGTTAPLHEERARERANGHAGTCRSKPLPTA